MVVTKRKKDKDKDDEDKRPRKQDGLPTPPKQNATPPPASPDSGRGSRSKTRKTRAEADAPTSAAQGTTTANAAFGAGNDGTSSTGQVGVATNVASGEEEPAQDQAPAPPFIGNAYTWIDGDGRRHMMTTEGSHVLFSHVAPASTRTASAPRPTPPTVPVALAAPQIPPPTAGIPPVPPVHPGIATVMRNTYINGPNANQRAAGQPALQPTMMDGASGLRPHTTFQFNRDHFWPGRVIEAPNPVSALDPHAPQWANDPTQPCFRRVGPSIVCNKMRPMIVLWAWKYLLYALPMGTRGSRGMSAINDDRDKKAFVCVKDSRHTNFQNEGPNEHVTARMRPEIGYLDINSIVEVSDGAIVSFKDQITATGDIGRHGTNRLIELWEDYQQEAVKLGWDCINDGGLK